jgi:hypothetical protein
MPATSNTIFRLRLLALPVSLALAAVALLLVSLAPARGPALAAGDSGPVQNVQTGLTYGSLSAAIAATETLDGHHLTVAAGNYTENITITKSLVITGAGQEVTFLDGGGLGRVIYIPELVTVTLSGVAVRNGLLAEGYGAGLLNDGTLILADSKLYSNTVGDEYGGGIANSGGLSLTNVLVYSNTASYGAGIYSWGELTMMGGEISYNDASADGAGGLANEGTAALSNTRVHHNLAGYYAGGIANYGYTMTLTLVEIDHNTVLEAGGYGGGLNHEPNAGPAILTNVRIFANRVISGHANYGGGGVSVFNSTAILTMTNSAVFDNFVGASGPGGGVHVSYNAQVWIIDSAIYNNSAADGLGGGVDAGAASSGSEVHVVNSTIAGNSARAGGGLHSANQRVYITNTTFYSNSADTEPIIITETVAGFAAGGGNSLFGGGNLSGSVTLVNTLLAAGYPDNCGLAAAVTSNGYNLEDTTNSCGLAGTGDLPNASALLGPLALNGASLPGNLSHQPTVGSDAIDAGSNAVCAAFPVNNHDQRGRVRPYDYDAVEVGLCYIG